jgi:hypothetical protein
MCNSRSTFASDSATCVRKAATLALAVLVAPASLRVGCALSKRERDEGTDAGSARSTEGSSARSASRVRGSGDGGDERDEGESGAVRGGGRDGDDGVECGGERRVDDAIAAVTKSTRWPHHTSGKAGYSGEI